MVYLAQRYHPSGLAAIKVMLPHLRGGAWRQRLEREASVLTRLRSPFVVRCYEHGTLRDGRLFIAMEYLRGQPLSETLRSCGRLEAGRSVVLVLQAAHAVAEAHGLGVIHRDLKPANLFHLTEGHRERVKVLDFGISVPPGEGELAGRVLGTPRYMAPEQIASSDGADARSDIFSLGMVLYEMLSGRLPYPEEPVVKLLSRRMLEPPMPLEVYLPRPQLPASLYTTVKRMIAWRAQDRFGSMEQLIDALMKVHADLQRPAQRADVQQPEPAGRIAMDRSALLARSEIDLPSVVGKLGIDVPSPPGSAALEVPRPAGRGGIDRVSALARAALEPEEPVWMATEHGLAPAC
jgi:serine/threonine-protein kinase